MDQPNILLLTTATILPVVGLLLIGAVGAMLFYTYKAKKEAKYRPEAGDIEAPLAASTSTGLASPGPASPSPPPPMAPQPSREQQGEEVGPMGHAGGLATRVCLGSDGLPAAKGEEVGPTPPAIKEEEEDGDYFLPLPPPQADSAFSLPLYRS